MIAEDTLKQVPLHDVHVELGAKMVPFAGYSMPVQYKAGVLKEHQFTRTSAGLFDVSHMGQMVVRPRSGKVDMSKVVDHFNRRCRAVLQVPFDPHLEEGAEISLDRLKLQTREALIELAAVVAGGFGGTRRDPEPEGRRHRA